MHSHNLRVLAKKNMYRFTVYTLEQIFVHPFFFVGKIIAAKLMRRAPWIPLLLGIIILVIVITMICFSPTDQKSTSNNTIHKQILKSISSVPEQIRTLWKKIRTKELKKILQLHKNIFTITSLLVTLLATSFYSHLLSGTVFVQYMEEIFGVDLARVRYPALFQELSLIIIRLLKFKLIANGLIWGA
jgi:hypothetical protein